MRGDELLAHTMLLRQHLASSSCGHCWHWAQRDWLTGGTSAHMRPYGLYRFRQRHWDWCSVGANTMAVCNLRGGTGTPVSAYSAPRYATGEWVKLIGKATLRGLGLQEPHPHRGARKCRCLVACNRVCKAHAQGLAMVSLKSGQVVDAHGPNGGDENSLFLAGLMLSSVDWPVEGVCSQGNFERRYRPSTVSSALRGLAACRWRQTRFGRGGCRAHRPWGQLVNQLCRLLGSAPPHWWLAGTSATMARLDS